MNHQPQEQTTPERTSGSKARKRLFWKIKKCRRLPPHHPATIQRRENHMKKSIEIEITKKDMQTLDKYGFNYEMNIKEYLHSIAEEIRACEKAQKDARG